VAQACGEFLYTTGARAGCDLLHTGPLDARTQD